jgi:hypothetical protein
MISGPRQLVASRGCRLYVLSLQFEPAGAADGQALPDAVASVRGLLEGHAHALDAFNRMLGGRTSYRDEDAAMYTDRYRLRTTPSLVPVGTGFPRITPDLLTRALGKEVAGRVSDVRYRINLEGMGVLDGSTAFRRILP